MMTMAEIKHHLSDALLMGYAAGALPEAFSLVVATHVSLCDDCRARLGAFEALGGAVVEEEAGIAMAEGSLEATLRRIAGAPQAPDRARPRLGAAPCAWGRKLSTRFRPVRCSP